MRYFLSPKVLFGKGALNRLGGEIQGQGDKAVLITGKFMARFCDTVVEQVKNAGYEVKVWDGAEPEPSVEVAGRASQLLSEFQPQLIIGFGGGSAIDTAKAAWLLYERPDLADTELDKTVGPKTRLNLRKKARFAAVPTTSGTGSDVTWAIILTDTARHRKMPFANNEIVPDITVLEPELTAGMPKNLTASTGMDVLGHAIEGYTGRQQTDFSDGLCLQAMKLTFDWLPRACKDGGDLVAREKMQNAATIAGLGFGNSNTSLGHALAHAIGATFGIPHGRAVGLAIVCTTEYMASSPPLPNAPDPIDRLSTAARFVGIDAPAPKEAIAKLIQKIKELAREIGEPLSLKEAGVTEEQINQELDTLVSLASKDVNIFSSPCECNEENLRQLFLKMREGK